MAVADENWGVEGEFSRSNPVLVKFGGQDFSLCRPSTSGSFARNMSRYPGSPCSMVNGVGPADRPDWYPVVELRERAGEAPGTASGTSSFAITSSSQTFGINDHRPVLSRASLWEGANPPQPESHQGSRKPIAWASSLIRLWSLPSSARL
jgi:hypothetical protein